MRVVKDFFLLVGLALFVVLTIMPMTLLASGQWIYWRIKGEPTPEQLARWLYGRDFKSTVISIKSVSHFPLS